MKFKEYLAEAKTNTVVFAFGRFNPISTGHELLANKVAAVAKQHNGKALVVASASVDSKKNPLSVDDKVKYMRKAFTNVEVQSAKKYGSTFIDVAKKLSSEGVKNLVMIAGSDRVDEYEKLLNKYNGKEFNFDSVKVVSAGERDPDAEGITGISGTKLRQAAADKDFKTFRSGTPSKINDADVKKLMELVRKGMNLKEDYIAEGVHDKGIFKAVFLGGGPGSGKDYVLSNTMDGHGLTELNSDKALEYLMDKEDLDMKMPENEEKQRNEVRKRAKNITELRQRLALHGRNGLIINGTGDDPEKYKKIKEKLEALGYETTMVMVNTADEVSRQRNVERGQRGGRTVPEDIRKEKWDAVQASRAEHAKIFGDSYVEFDNSEDLRSAPPEVVEAKTKEMDGIFKNIQKFVNKAPKNEKSKSWIASELEKKDTAPIVKSAKPHQDAGHQEEGNKLGLEYYGFGRYGKDGKVTHRSVHGSLVPVEKQNDKTPDIPVMGSGSSSNKEFKLKDKQKEKLQDIKAKAKLPKDIKKEELDDEFESFLSEAVTVTITGDTVEEVTRTIRLLKSDEVEMTEEEEQEDQNTMSDPGAYNILTLGTQMIKEDLRKWFSKSNPQGNWKRYNTKGEAIGPCARENPNEPKPKCMSNAKAASLSKKERASAVRAKRRHDPDPDRKGQPINVSNFGKGKISEAAYEGNIGMMEVMKFHQKANEKQKKEFKKHLSDKNYKEAWKMIQHVSGTKLVGKQFEEVKKEKFLTDKNGKPRVFMLRAAAAKEAHVNNGTVQKQTKGYKVKLHEDSINELYNNDFNSMDAVYTQVVPNATAREISSGTSTRKSCRAGICEGDCSCKKEKITLSKIKETWNSKNNKVEESIDKGIEPGISMAGAGESPARDMGEKLSKKGKATQVVPTSISELTGDETTASIGDQKEDELKKKGISLTTFKKRNFI